VIFVTEFIVMLTDCDVIGRAEISCELRYDNSNSRHRSQPLRKLIPPRSREQQPLLRPRHSDVEEFHGD
jgi:hypothetical protein